MRSLPRAELVVMQVCRLRPKSTEECRIETADILAWTAYLRGEVPPAPGAPPRRWPVNVGFDYYLTPKGMILSCKVCPARGSAATRDTPTPPRHSTRAVLCSET